MFFAMPRGTPAAEDLVEKLLAILTAENANIDTADLDDIDRLFHARRDERVSFHGPSRARPETTPSGRLRTHRNVSRSRSMTAGC